MSYLGKRKLEFKPLMEKKASINLEIVELQQKKELEEKALNEANKRLQSITEEITNLDNVFLSVKDEIVAFEKECTLIISDGVEAVKTAEQVIQSLVATSDSINTKIIEQKKELAKILEQKKIAQEEITREWEKLSKFKNDLDIYKKRLQKQIKESNLEDNIIIHELN